MKRLAEIDFTMMDASILAAAERFTGEQRILFLKRLRDRYKATATWWARAGCRSSAELYRVFAARSANEHRESLDMTVRPGAA